jgi:hypothetical protein
VPRLHTAAVSRVRAVPVLRGASSSAARHHPASASADPGASGGPAAAGAEEHAMTIERLIKGLGLALALTIVVLLIVAAVQQSAIQRRQDAQDAAIARHGLELDVLRAQAERNQTESALIRAYLENPYRSQQRAILPKSAPK